MPAKRAGAKLDFTIDWAPFLDPDGDTISTAADGSTWTVPTGITKEAESKSTKTTTIWLSGGTVGQTYDIVNTIKTVGGRIQPEVLTITVEAP